MHQVRLALISLIILLEPVTPDGNMIVLIALFAVVNTLLLQRHVMSECCKARRRALAQIRTDVRRLVRSHPQDEA